MRCRKICTLVGLFALTLAGLFIGIEETPREHRTDYEFFVKRSAQFRLIYRNPVLCGECDVEPFYTLNADSLEKLARFCKARFDLEDVRTCYAVLEEK